MATKKVTHYRDAGSGEYVTPKYAQSHPNTTVKETDKITVKTPTKK